MSPTGIHQLLGDISTPNIFEKPHCFKAVVILLNEKENSDLPSQLDHDTFIFAFPSALPFQ